MDIPFLCTTMQKRVLIVLLPAIILITNSSLAQENAKDYFERGESFFSQKLFDSAFLNYEHALKLFRQKGNEPEVINTLSKAGQSLIGMRKTEEAISLLLGELQTAEKLEDTLKVRETYYETISDAYYYAGNAFSSLEYYKKVHGINIQRGGTPPQKMMTMVRILGVLNGNAGNLQKAVDHYTEYAALVKEVHGENHLLMSDAFNYLGVIYRHRGEYDMALDYYKKSIAIAENYTAEERAMIAPRFRSVAPVYNNIGTVYHELKDHDNALTYTLKALDLHESDKSGNIIGLASIHSSLGTTYTILDRHEEALANKQKAKAMFIAAYGEKHGRVATQLKNIGDSYFKLKEYAVAKKYYQESLVTNLNSHGKFHPNTGESYMKLAAILEVNGELDEALQNVQAGIRCIVQDFESHSIYENPDINSLCHVKILLAEQLTKKGDLLVKLFALRKKTEILKAAHHTYALAVAFSEVVRNDLVDNRSKMYLAENSKALFGKSIQTALQLHGITKDSQFIDAAFAVMEKNKSRLLLESMQYSQLKNTLDVPVDLFNEENSLKSQVAYYEEQILDERVKGDAKDSLKIVKDQQGLFETRRKLESLIQQLQRDYPKYHFAKYSAPSVTISDIQKSLHKSELLLEFFSGDSAMYVFYATARDNGILSIDRQVQDDIAEMMHSIRSRNLPKYSELAHALYKKMLEPVLTLASTPPQKIIVIPDGIVAYMPFELLLTQSTTGKKYAQLPYAIRNLNFSYGLSSTLMFNDFKDHKIDRSKKFTGFAPQFEGAVVAQRDLPGNIPYAQREVHEISRTFPGEVYIGADATESNFRKLAERSGVIHLATHASIDENDANFSKLYFASPDTLQDGMLHAYEIFTLDMNAELVTLSACNTALGVYKEGEGVMSLSRAFAYAGCESIVTSLWPSQDQTTADIMGYFYQNLADGMEKDKALQQAKLKFLETSDNIKSDPFYWAGFVLIGDPAPLNSNTNMMAIMVGALVLLGLTTTGFVFWKKRKK